MTTQNMRHLKPGEALAMLDRNIQRGPQGFFWMMADPPKRNEYQGDVAIVHVRGELEHHVSPWGGESYEGLRQKFAEAIAGGVSEIMASEDQDEEEDGAELTPTPPRTVITVIDSPGGVVSGLNQTCSWMRRQRKAHPEINFVVYVNEMAASAAYALACSMSDRGCIVAAPISSVSGSIGVISTMISQARKNKKDGYDVELLTSGARKADGHVHAPLTDEAMAVEKRRVDTLAQSFFKLVAKTRGLSIEKIEALQAGIFLSKDALKRGLVDEIMSFDDVMLAASGETPTAGGNKTDRRVQQAHASPSSNSSLSYDSSKETDMALQLVAALKATLAKETDPTKRALLTASIEAYKKSKHTIEKHETEEGDEEEEEEEEEEKGGEGEEKKAEDGGDDDGEESKKSSKKSELSDDDDDDGDEKDSDDEDEDEEEDEEEEEEAKASLALVRDLSGGLKGSAARGALKALVGTALQAAKDVAALKREKRDEEKASLIASLKGKANKLELAWLRDQDLKAVRSFVKMRAKSGFVMTGEDQLIKPKHTAPDSYEALPESSRAMVDAAVQTVPGDAAAKETFKATLVKKLHAAENANSVRRF